ncbi:MAG TPA: amino acid permease [Puia sp.]|jgi:APA family basic amino acid/polyamine antiporter
MAKNEKLGVFDCTMIVVSLVIGMGIFRTPVNVARQVPDSYLFFFTWIVGGLVALCGALTYAEIGSRLPVMGGYYKIFSYGYHPSIAFAVNCIILISNAASLAGVALIGAEYISGVLFPDIIEAQALQVREIAIALFSIILFYGVNLLGLKMSAKTQNVLTIIKISLIVLLITPLFFATHSIPVSLQHTSFPGWLSYLKGFGVGLIAVSFTYGGYQQTINFGSDIERPGRNIPRAIFTGIFIIIVLYLSINYAYIRVIGLDQMRSAKGIASVMAAHVFGDAAGKILSILLFLSVLAYVNVLLLSNPRVMYAMAEDKVLPAIFSRRNASNGVLFTSLTAFATACVLIVFWMKAFDRILSFTIFLDCFGMAASAGAIFKLRKQKVRPEGKEIYQMKLYPILPLIFITAYSFVAISIAIDTPWTALTALIVIGVFMLIYFISRGQRLKN